MRGHSNFNPRDSSQILAAIDRLRRRLHDAEKATIEATDDASYLDALLVLEAALAEAGGVIGAQRRQATIRSNITLAKRSKPQ